MKTIKFLLVMLFSIVIAACGGGGGSSPPPPPATFSISGAVSGAALPGVTINLSGTSTKTATTNATGNYSFTGLTNGSYTVTPLLAGNTFSPTGTAVTVSGANTPNINFVATALGGGVSTYSISGTVSGTATSGVTLTLGGDNTGSVVSGAGGTYTFGNLLAGSYTVTPSLTGFTFSPANKAVTLAANSIANDFIATAVVVPHSLSGNVSGVTGGLITIDVTGAASATTTTDASGNYTVTGLFDGTYNVAPSKTGYTFAPNSTSVTMAGANVTAPSFAGTANSTVLATVNGAVTGAWVEGLTVTMSGCASGTTTTNASGAYSFPNVPSGTACTFTATPLAGYNYTNGTATLPAGSSTAVTATNIVASSKVASNSISGTVNYAGTKSGRITIKVIPSNCAGCSPSAGTTINAPGAFTIRGVSAGSWDIVAQMDTLGNGAANVNNPTGSITNVAASGNTITLVDPVTPTATIPMGLAVYPSSNSAMVSWDQVRDATGQRTTTAYQISWGTDVVASNGGVITVTSNDTSVYLQSNLTNGTAYYYKIASVVGSTASAYSAVVGPITPSASTPPGSTVSGAVTVSPSVTLTGPMYVGLFSGTGVYFTRHAAPTSTQSYSVTAATNGSYYPFVFIDMNNNGVVDAGDIHNTDGSAANITVSSSMTNNITLSSASATAQLRTNHDVTNNNYALRFGVNSNSKHAVSATVISGVNVPLPLDIAVTQQGDDVWVNTAVRPTVGNSYQLRVKFSDGTTQDMTVSVTGVLDSPAQNLAVVNNGTGGSTLTAPLFTWAAPVSPPASYTYMLNVWGNNANWWYDGDAGRFTATSVLYNVDGRAFPASLVSGVTYNWEVLVQDGNRNQVSTRTTYTVP